MIRKTATIKRFEYLPLGTELKKQNEFAKTITRIKQGL